MSMPLNAFQALPPHRRLESFMGEALVERLLAYAESRSGEFTQTRLAGGKVDGTVRSSLMLRDLGDLRAELEERFLAVLDWAVQELKLSPIKLAQLELELVAHGDGAFFKEHIDTSTDRSAAGSGRALTGVYYFHRYPKGFDGGDLRLHAIAPGPGGSRRFVDIPPGPDTFVLFPSWAPHEVLPISCPSGAFRDSRFAINCWYRHRW